MRRAHRRGVEAVPVVRPLPSRNVVIPLAVDSSRAGGLSLAVAERRTAEQRDELGVVSIDGNASDPSWARAHRRISDWRVISQQVVKRLYNPLAAGECGQCLLWVINVVVGQGRPAIHVRRAPKADITLVNEFMP